MFAQESALPCMQMSPVLAKKDKNLSLLEGFCNENSPILEKVKSFMLEWLFSFATNISYISK